MKEVFEFVEVIKRVNLLFLGPLGGRDMGISTEAFEQGKHSPVRKIQSGRHCGFCKR